MGAHTGYVPRAGLRGASDHFIGFPRSRTARGIRDPEPKCGNGGFTDISVFSGEGTQEASAVPPKSIAGSPEKGRKKVRNTAKKGHFDPFLMGFEAFSALPDKFHGGPLMKTQKKSRNVTKTSQNGAKTGQKRSKSGFLTHFLSFLTCF